MTLNGLRSKLTKLRLHSSSKNTGKKPKKIKSLWSVKIWKILCLCTSRRKRPIRKGEDSRSTSSSRKIVKLWCRYSEMPFSKEGGPSAENRLKQLWESNNKELWLYRMSLSLWEWRKEAKSSLCQLKIHQAKPRWCPKSNPEQFFFLRYRKDVAYDCIY